MQRGVLTLNKEEMIELFKVESFNRIVEDKESLSDENRIFVNEEELEGILDEIGIIENNEILLSARSKISDLLRSFRNL
jgi:hypothetical protein